MLVLKAKIRKESGKKVKSLREKSEIPAVLYGPKITNQSLTVSAKEFEKAFKVAGESSLINLEVGEKKLSVLIHALELNPVSLKPIHIDFYQPRLDVEITATIPLAFEGTASAVKDLAGTLVKNIQTITVKALPQNLPHEIKVNIEKLKTFEDFITVKDLILPAGVKVLKEENDVVVQVVPPEKVEEELAKPVEEKVEEVEKVETKKPAEETAEAETGPKEKKPAAK